MFGAVFVVVVFAVVVASAAQRVQIQVCFSLERYRPLVDASNEQEKRVAENEIMRLWCHLARFYRRFYSINRQRCMNWRAVETRPTSTGRIFPVP